MDLRHRPGRAHSIRLRGRPGLGMLAAAGAVVLAVGGSGTLAAVRAPRAVGGPAVHPAVHLAAAPAQDTGDGSQSGVSGGALFGGTYPLVAEESALGRELAIVRLYYSIGDSFPGPAAYQNLMAGGRTILASLDSPYSYPSVAAGEHDAAILSFLEAMNSDAIKYNLGSIYVSFEHEPDSDHHRPMGTPSQFVQAWDHIHELAVQNHLDWNDGGRLHWVLILVHNTYSSWRAGAFWPGADEVDILGADGYNSYACGDGGQKQVQTPSILFHPVVNFAASHGGLPVFVVEWGSDTVGDGAQANFISQMQSYVSDEPSIAAALYWDTNAGACDYQVNHNTSSVSALAAMAASASMQGSISGSGG